MEIYAVTYSIFQNLKYLLLKFYIRFSFFYLYQYDLHDKGHRVASGTPVTHGGVCQYDHNESIHKIGIIVDGKEAGHVYWTDRPILVPEIEGHLFLDGIYIFDISVNKDFRGKGLAKGLLNEVIYCAPDGVNKIYSLVAITNFPSRCLFEERGFNRGDILIYIKIINYGFSNSVLNKMRDNL
jgi:GNAT superfamily N-acetyltransferase